MADALSRCLESEETPECLTAISTNPSRVSSSAQPAWIQQITLSYTGDDDCQQLITQLLLDPSSQPDYQYVNGLLKKQNRIVVGASTDIRTQLIQAMHTSPLGGHSGQTACYQPLRSLFHWPLLQQDVNSFIRGCEICQKNKDEHVKSPGLFFTTIAYSPASMAAHINGLH